MAVATVIVGLSVAALMLLITSCTMVGGESTRTSSALGYAKNISEMCDRMTRTQLLAMNNVTYSPVVDAQANTITQGRGWSQTITAAYVNPTNAAGNVVGGQTNLVRVSISVKQGAREQLRVVRLFAFTEG